MKQRVNQFQEENRYLAGQLSHRSKRSNRSHKSLRSNISRKTKHSMASNSVPAPRVRGDRGQPVEPAGKGQPSRGALENHDLKDSVKETIRQSKQGLGGLSRHLALSTSKARLQTSGQGEVGLKDQSRQPAVALGNAKDSGAAKSRGVSGAARARGPPPDVIVEGPGAVEDAAAEGKRGPHEESKE